MKIVGGWQVVMIRVAQLSGMALHLGSPPVEARREAPPRLVAFVPGFVVVRFWVVTPRQVGAAVGLAQQLLAVVPRARLLAGLPVEHLMPASQWQIAASG